MSGDTRWGIDDLKVHLQYAVDLEFWTIPFYMSAMYSITDPSTEAYQLIQSVVYQEMLHVQLAANVANAFGAECVKFKEPVYGEGIPHLDFKKDDPNPEPDFTPWSSDIGPLDTERINAMCLIEYPEWGTLPPGELNAHTKDYGSIGEFYQAVTFGARQHMDEIEGRRRQVDLFGRYYADFKNMKVTKSGKKGWRQVGKLINVIVEQGEGQSDRHSEIPPKFRSAADDPAAVIGRFDRFIAIREGGDLPAVYPAVREPETDDQRHALGILQKNFKAFRSALEDLFGGKPADGPPVIMSTLGGNILTCWQRGVVPSFAEPGELRREPQQ